MNCRKVCSLLSAYMDGELTGAESLRIRDHLARCAACSREHESLLAIKLAICGLPVAEPGEDFEQRLKELVASLPPESGWRHRLLAPFILDGPRNRMRLAAAFAAAALLMLAISVRWTLHAPTATASSRVNAEEFAEAVRDMRRERDLRFAQETFERPQPVSYRTTGDGQPFERGPAVDPITVWEPATPVTSP